MRLQRQAHEPLPVQTKLTVGPANDRFEREADQVARHVVSEIGSQSSGASERVSRQSIEDEELLQGKREPVSIRRASIPSAVGPEGGPVSDDTSRAIAAARGGGRPLTDGVRRSMEGAFGSDFSAVRVHDGPTAGRLNEQLGARAFTTGSDIFVRAGQLSNGNRSATELLAHELTHVVQQGAAPLLE